MLIEESSLVEQRHIHLASLAPSTDIDRRKSDMRIGARATSSLTG